MDFSDLETGIYFFFYDQQIVFLLQKVKKASYIYKRLLSHCLIPIGKVHVVIVILKEVLVVFGLGQVFF